MSDEPKTILLIGNGFDLRTGIKTTFKDFLRFVIYGIICHNYDNPETLEHEKNRHGFDFKKDFEDKVSIVAKKQHQKEKTNKTNFPKHPLEILLKIPLLKIPGENSNKKITEICRKFIDTEFGKTLFKYIFKPAPYLMDAISISPKTYAYFLSRDNGKELIHRVAIIYGLDEDWVSLGEDDLIYHQTPLAEDLETIAYIFETYFDNNRNNIALWSDVETVIELLITKDKKLQTKFQIEKNDLPEWTNETLKSFSEGLELFEFLLTQYFLAIQNEINIDKKYADEFITKIEDNYKSSFDQRTRITSGLGNLLKKTLYTPDIIINYNYTNIAERIYENLSQQPPYALPKPQYTYINGSLEPKHDPSKEGFATNIVIGYTNSNSGDVPKELYHFEKLCRRVIKDTEYFDLNHHIPPDKYILFDILIIGHSCCIADSDIIGSLLAHEKLHNALVLCHTKDDLISINNNLKHILGPKKYGELMTHNYNKRNHNLFFAVEEY